MSIIQVLPAEIAGRIAAGEVIERPASVVKELVENSIDAKATRIRVQIEQGGHRLIQVIDNGCGMDRSDALMCLEAHATSKLTKDGDVGQIVTLGFRGEAIPSIASVSRFQLQTRRKEDDIGTEVIVDNGIIRDVNDCGCAPGTNIKVAYLFGNLPVRRKFMKGPETEEGHIEEMILMLALARPDISFSLFLNGRETIKATATMDLASRVVMLLGREMFDAMLPVQYEEAGIRVRGFVSMPGYTRSSRREQRLIINGRAASAETLFFAIRDAYDTLILKGRYPGTVLYVDMPPELVDVNVHPAKREVRFSDARLVGGIVAAAIRRALRQMPGSNVTPNSVHNGIEPQPFRSEPRQAELTDVRRNEFMEARRFVPAEPPVPPEPSVPPAPRVPQKPSVPPEPSVPPAPRVPQKPSVPPEPSVPPAPRVPQKPSVLPEPSVPPAPPVPCGPSSAMFSGEGEQIQPSLPSIVPPPDALVHEAPAGGVVSESAPRSAGVPQGRRGALDFRVCGRLGKQYILAESDTGLVVVDIRAAHQRLLFEQLLSNLKDNRVPRQQLLIPVTVELGHDDARFLNGQLKKFDAIGFTVEPFGGNTFVVTSVPASYPYEDLGKSLRDILEDMRQNRTVSALNPIHLAQLASRHAVSRKDNLTDVEVQRILHDLARAQMPYADPAGNPTMIHFSFLELEKRFKNG